MKSFGKNECQKEDEKICLFLCIAKFFDIKLEKIGRNRKWLNDKMQSNKTNCIEDFIKLTQKKFPNYTFLMIPREWIGKSHKYSVFLPTENIDLICVVKTETSEFHAVWAKRDNIENDIILTEDPYGHVGKDIKYKDDDIIAYCFFICNSYRPKTSWYEKIKRMLHFS